MEKKKKSKKIFINLLIFILLIIFTFSLVLKDQDVTEILKISATVKNNIYLLQCLQWACLLRVNL